MPIRPLQTERLLLKPLAMDDAAFILRQFSNDDVSRYLYDEEPFTTLDEAEGLIRFYNADEPRDQYRWVLVERATGEKLGTCGFHRWDRARRACELGYDLYPTAWGRGYMREALPAALAFARDDMGVRTIEAHISPDNRRSVAEAVSQGFADTGRTYMEVFRGKEYPHAIYELRFADSATEAADEQPARNEKRGAPMQILKSSEDYLEAMLMMQERNGVIRSVDVAAELNVTKPSVSYAAKRLRENGYITMGKDSLITLTDKGMAIAQRIYERHRLLTDYLLRIGVSEQTAREDACKIEHDISDETFRAIRKHTGCQEKNDPS